MKLNSLIKVSKFGRNSLRYFTSKDTNFLNTIKNPKKLEKAVVNLDNIRSKKIRGINPKQYKLDGMRYALDKMQNVRIKIMNKIKENY